MNQWELPYSININGTDWAIRTDFRAILDILIALQNPDYEDDEKLIISLTIFYPEFENMAGDDYIKAYEEMREFIDMGIEDEHQSPRTMDWEQDAALIIPAINKVIGHEVRAVSNMHWWTFLGAYMEIGEGAFATIVSIRQKKAKGKKLEKWEREFYKENKSRIDFKNKYTEQEQAERERLNALLG